jgi:hypothetical protein
MQSHDKRRFLDFHARDVRFKLYMPVILHDRKLPTDAAATKRTEYFESMMLWSFLALLLLAWIPFAMEATSVEI